MRKIFLLFLAVSFSKIAIADTSNPAAKKVLHAYKAKCDLVADKPIVLKMTDTLYNMATRLNNNNYKITARCLKLTYYFNRENCRDSVSKYSEMVKSMCQNPDDDTFYFFAWAESIADRISRRQFNLAMNEINELRKFSEDNHNMMGLSTCYSQMTDLFCCKGNYELAAQYMKKCVDLTIKYKMDDYNISVYYSTLASYLLKNGQTDEAYKYIIRSYQTARAEGHVVQTQAAEAEYWYQKRNVSQLKRILNAASKVNIAYNDRTLYSAQYYYNLLIGKYAVADIALNNMYNCGAILKDDYLLRKAELYSKMPDASRKAIDYWKQYSLYKDSISRTDAKTEISEFATIMDMTQLKIQNQQIQIAEKSSRMHKAIIMLAISLLFIAILTVFLIKNIKLNTHLKNSQNQLKRQNEELQNAKKLITREKEYIQRIHDMEEAFVNNISFELASPVNSIIGFGQALHEVKDDPKEVSSCANVIEQTGKMLHKMLSEMNIMFSLHLDRSKIILTPTSINEVCRVAIEQMSKITTNGSKIILNTWKEEFAIMSDNTSIAAIIQHLIDNAIKYAQNSDIIVDIILSESKRDVIISVSDNGPGIPDVKRETVFEGFTKLDKFTPGAGLGLPISRITAMRINANLTIDETYTNGSRFILSLPAVRYKETY